jgi:hypothetical protein
MTDEPREPQNEDERRAAIMALYGVGEVDANFIMDIEDGKQESDVVEGDNA